MGRYLWKSQTVRKYWHSGQDLFSIILIENRSIYNRLISIILIEFHPQPWMAKKSSDVVKPRKITGDILHKNSFYYNQHITLDEYHKPKLSDYCCEWRDCRAKFLSNKELLQHVQDDHVSNLPLYGSSNYLNQGQLTCQWRKCKDSKCYPARYKLLLHLQRCHCRERTHEKVKGRYLIIQVESGVSLPCRILVCLKMESHKNTATEDTWAWNKSTHNPTTCMQENTVNMVEVANLQKSLKSSLSAQLRVQNALFKSPQI